MLKWMPSSHMETLVILTTDFNCKGIQVLLNDNMKVFHSCCLFYIIHPFSKLVSSFKMQPERISDLLDAFIPFFFNHTTY